MFDLFKLARGKLVELLRPTNPTSTHWASGRSCHMGVVRTRQTAPVSALRVEMARTVAYCDARRTVPSRADGGTREPSKTCSGGVKELSFIS